jgi:DNA-binding NtrC family response regulator
VGYRILKADDVYDAIQIAEQHKNELKLLITDMIMPGMNGLQLYKKISTTCSELGVIYMSGYTNNVISDHGFMEKGLHFMQKPFVIEELLRKVRDVLNGSS